MDKKLQCQISILSHPPVSPNHTHCPSIWDTLMCWPRTRAGTVAEQPCPDYIDKFKLDQNATRTCLQNGSWYVNPDTRTPWTNFTLCMINHTGPPFPSLIRSHMGWIRLMYNINYGLSLGSLVLAVLIMLSFKRLHCPRNTVHLNLFVSFILRASVSFLRDNLLVKGIGFASDVIQTPFGVTFRPDRSHWGCKLFFTTFHYVLGANYMWILVEALYLHTLITVAPLYSERTGLKYYILFGWTMPLSFVIPWVIVRATKEDVLCWNTHPTEEYFWIMKGPIVASLVISFLLFISLLRVLYIKLSAVCSPEAKKFRRLSFYRKLAKSTLVLVPLFGVHYIVFLFLPAHVDERTELVKLYFEMFFNSIQGFFVALLFCFFNAEVQGEIRKAWSRFQLTYGAATDYCCRRCCCCCWWLLGRAAGTVCGCPPCPGRAGHGRARGHHHHHHPHLTYSTYCPGGKRESLGSLHPCPLSPDQPRLHPQGGGERGAADDDRFSPSRLLVMETTPLHPLSSSLSSSLSHAGGAGVEVVTNGKGAYGGGRGESAGEPIVCRRSSATTTTTTTATNSDCGSSSVRDEYRVS